MTQATKKTAWMWLAGDQLLGLSIDLESERLTWVWQAGCHCADEDEIVQSVSAFHREGTPALIGPLPEDVAAEVEAVLPAA
jgi:hypothetical protein